MKETTHYIDAYLLCTVKICLQLILLSQGNLFVMIGSLEVMHEFNIYYSQCHSN